MTWSRSARPEHSHISPHLQMFDLLDDLVRVREVSLTHVSQDGLLLSQPDAELGLLIGKLLPAQQHLLQQDPLVLRPPTHRRPPRPQSLQLLFQGSTRRCKHTVHWSAVGSTHSSLVSCGINTQFIGQLWDQHTVHWSAVGSTHSSLVSCGINTQFIGQLWDQHTVHWSAVGSTHSSLVSSGINTQFIGQLQDQHTVHWSAAGSTHSSLVSCGINTQFIGQLWDQHTVHWSAVASTHSSLVSCRINTVHWSAVGSTHSSPVSCGINTQFTSQLWDRPVKCSSLVNRGT